MSEVSPYQAVAQLPRDRTVLPIPELPRPKYTQLDVRGVPAPPFDRVKAPAGAPNVLVVLIDDFGFGQSSAFGGPIQMPTAERLAKEGLRYTQFHTTALCSPTRSALLTGRNHHVGNMGSVTETATTFPGNTGQRPDSVAPLAEMLRLNGYVTGAFGKSHETAAWEVGPSGPTTRWPTRSGFDKFYGFLGGETNQWSPMLYDGLAKVELPRDPNYHFMTDMTDKAIEWIRSVKSISPDTPFFTYFAPGATHAPHHVPREWIAKYKGKFDQGWDKLREETLARQIRLGVVPPDTKLAPKPDAIKDWDKLTPTEKRVFAREMEVFAGFAEYTDHEVGRLIQSLDSQRVLDDTLVFYILGDNGASAEGGMAGRLNEMSYFNDVDETVEEVAKHLDDLGGPHSYNHYAAGWAVAGDTPFSWTKQVASSFGGTRNPMIVRWPTHIHAKGELRTQFHHVIDIAPTILQAAGLPEPRMVNGVAQTPIQGVAMEYSFDDPAAKSRHTTQYFEIFGNRAIYHEGWLAGTVHRAPWDAAPRHALAEDQWELYDTTKDFSLADDLAKKSPQKLAELESLFMKVASDNHVLPIDDRSIERVNASLVGRPDVMQGRTSLTIFPGMTALAENVFINVKNRSHAVTADLDVGDASQTGVIIAQGGRFGGWSLYLDKGRPTYTYNFLDRQHFTVASPTPLSVGKAVVRMEFAYDGGGPGKGGKVTLLVSGKKVAEGRVDRTQPRIFSVDEGADVGVDEGTPVSEAYQDGGRFKGKIERVTIDLTGDAKSAVSGADGEALRVAAVRRVLSE
ncbi:MAG TPA: arylsulfatase [Polyangiaceae bacterium]|nr:arylsulfatase [Polyangiaceae bacterium]